MFEKICNHAAMMVLGVFVGAVVAAAWMGVGQGSLVQATATHGESNFAIATGPADNAIEAFYFLDFLTGDMKAAVLQPRLGKFNSFFTYNILNDFKVQGQKNPKYLMVTGTAELPRGSGSSQIGASLIYVAEATTGQVCAYALPFSSSLNNAGKPQRDSLRLIASGTFRTTAVRD